MYRVRRPDQHSCPQHQCDDEETDVGGGVEIALVKLAVDVAGEVALVKLAVDVAEEVSSAGRHGES